MQAGPGVVSSDGRCRCGNSATVACADCRHPVCSLCVRTLGQSPVCLACRSSRIRMEEERHVRDVTRSGRIAQIAGSETRRNWIALVAFVLAMLAIMTSVVGSVLGESGSARAERHAREALERVADAERAYRRTAPAFVNLEKLIDGHLVAAPTVPGYQLRVDLAKDGHTFWVRAIPEQDRLRGMILDESGAVVFVGGGD